MAGDERIRARAYQLWEEAGQPQGRDEEFWSRAVQEVGGDKGSDGSGKPAGGASGDPASDPAQVNPEATPGTGMLPSIEEEEDDDANMAPSG